jgi:hypothetical protein
MKANEAPEKLYLIQHNGLVCYCRNNKDDIEFIRTDAFIDKACDYLMEYEFNDSPTIADRRKRVEEFRNYMENKA